MLRWSRICLCVKPSDLVRTAGHKQHVFRWGVGNKFRSQNANRFTPVHHARPKEVTVEENYFESPDSAIMYDSLNEQWDVYWYEHSKLHAKPFPVKKFGIQQSKAEAVAYLSELKASGRFCDMPPNPAAATDNVFWDDRLQAWIACVDGKSRAFSAVKHGVTKAQQLAESFASKSETFKLRQTVIQQLRQLKSE